jgi:YVTN family beta-propeller protein
MLRLGLALLAFATALTALPSAAGARGVYVTNFGFFGMKTVLPGSLSIIDSRTNVAAPPIEFGTHPGAIAIAPDGRTAYLLNGEPSSVSPIDLATDRPVGPPIVAGKGLIGIAVSPDGTQVYVTDFTEDSVLVIDPRINRVVGDPIKVGNGPEDIAFTPDGAHAYVTNAEGKNVSVIDTALGQVTSTIPVGRRPDGIAITPDGSRVYVANDFDGTVSVIDTRTNAPAAPAIEVREGPDWVAASPDGRAVYVADFDGDAVSVIDRGSNEVLTTVETAEEPIGVAVSPDSRAWYVITVGDQMVTGMDARTEQPLGLPIAVGVAPGSLAFRPDQPPAARFSTPPVARPGVPVVFDASASEDPDGSIAGFAWSFGDGSAATSGGATPSHTFSAPGRYDVKLTLTDDEGCSTALVFTGQTASCNGSGVATATRAVTVAYPGVGVRCPQRAKRRGCMFKLQAVTRRRKGRAESAVARARVGAGRSAIVSLVPRDRFAGLFSPGAMVLVKRTSRIGRSRRTTIARLSIIR